MTKIRLCNRGKNGKLERDKKELVASATTPAITSPGLNENVKSPMEETIKKPSKEDIDKKEERCKKIVAKAMTKALKKAPSRQMKMKEVRRLIRKSNADFKMMEVSKAELKKYITDVIVANAEVMSQKGNIVRLL